MTHPCYIYIITIDAFYFYEIKKIKRVRDRMRKSKIRVFNWVLLLGILLLVHPSIIFSQCKQKTKYFINFSITNRCYADVNVSIHYRDHSGYWITTCWKVVHGFGKINEVTRRPAAPDYLTIELMSCRECYISAVSTDGKLKWGKDDKRLPVCGSHETYPFFQVVIPKIKKRQLSPCTKIFYYEYTLTCQQ